MGAAVLVIGMVGCGDSTPDTPGNAVLDFGDSVIRGDLDEAMELLCSERRAQVLAGEQEGLVLFEFVSAASTFYTAERATVEGDRAVQPLEVRPGGHRDDSDNERWEATLVSEDGRWRVCGVAMVG